MKSKSLILLTAMALSACNIVKKEVHYIEKQSAPAELAESMKLNQSGKKLTLEKKSLEKWYLLMPQAKIGGTTPQWEIFAAQVVYFKQSGKEVGLFQKNTLQAYQQISNDKLIQTFPVVEENAETVTVSWDQGLKVLAANSPWFINVEGLSDNDQISGGIDSGIEVISSFTHELTMKDNQLVVHQSVRIRNQQVDLASAMQNPNNPKLGLNPVEQSADLYLVMRPYKYNSNMKPIFSQKDKGYGLFTSPYVEDGRAELKEIVTRWDFSKDREPLTFAISSSFPAKYADVAEEALLYWNRVIGKNAVRVIKNVDPQSLPQERVVMVHWVDWDDAGFAYAGFNADPLTGEILLGQIFMTSSWVSNAQFESQQYDKKLVIPAGLGFSGLESSKYSCFFKMPKNFNQMAMSTSDGASGIVRTVIAHEAGHIMGMRHNFAGSYSAPITSEEIIQARENYIKENKTEGAPISSSIMDYENGLDTLLLGSYIKNNVLPYDKKLMDWTYNGADGSEKLTFCTDETIMLAAKEGQEIYGCQRFDSTPNPLLGDLHMDRLTAENTINTYHQLIANAVFKPNKPKRKLDDILNQIVIFPTVSNADNLKGQLKSDFQLPDTLGVKSWRDDMLEQKLRAAKTISLYQDVGGLGGMLLTLIPEFQTDYLTGTKLDKKIDHFIENLSAKGITFRGVEYQWTETELADLKEFYAKKFADFGANYAKSVMNFIVPNKEYAIDPVKKELKETDFNYNKVESLAGAGDKNILNLMNKMMLKHDGSLTLADGTVLPVYKFKFKFGFEATDINPVTLNLYKKDKLMSDDELKTIVPNQFKSDLALVIKSVSSSELLTRNAQQLTELVLAEPNNTAWKEWALGLIQQIKLYEGVL